MHPLEGLVPKNLASRIPIHQLHVSSSQTQQLKPDTPSSRVLNEKELLTSQRGSNGGLKQALLSLQIIEGGNIAQCTLHTEWVYPSKFLR